MRKTLLVLGLLAVGCGPTAAEAAERQRVAAARQAEADEDAWNEAYAEVSARARIDLECAEVDVSLLDKQGRFPTDVTVTGCGRTAMYTRALRRHFGKLSTMNTSWELVTMTRRAEREQPQAEDAGEQSAKTDDAH